MPTHSRRTRCKYGSTIAERLDFYCTRNSQTGCWEFGGALNKAGYALLKVKDKRRYIHRLSYENSVGPIPAGMHVLHRCDNPKCCEPSHLFLGTHTDNMRDMAAKGRRKSDKGAENSMAILSKENALAIYSDGRARKAIALQYGISVRAVSAIKTGQNWSHTTGHTR